MSLFRMVAKIALDASELEGGLKLAQSKVDTTMSAIGKRIAAAFSVGLILDFTRRVVNAAEEIKNLAEQFDESTDSIQQMEVAARKAGLQFDVYAGMLGRIKKAQADVLAGDEKAIALFNKLGIKASQPAFSILQNLGQSPNKASVIELLGPKAVRAINSLGSLGSADSGHIASEETIQGVAKLKDLYETFVSRWKVVGMGAVGVGGRLASNYDTMLDFSKRYGVERFAMGDVDPARNTLRTIGALLYAAVTGGRGGSSWSRIMDPVIASQMQGAGSPLFYRDPATEAGMPAGYTREGRSAGWVGPQPTAAFNFRRFFNRGLAERDLGQMEAFLAYANRPGIRGIDMGDRANVGGFFGPSADINSKLTRAFVDVDLIQKDIKEIREAVRDVSKDE